MIEINNIVPVEIVSIPELNKFGARAVIVARNRFGIPLVRVEFNEYSGVGAETEYEEFLLAQLEDNAIFNYAYIRLPDGKEEIGIVASLLSPDCLTEQSPDPDLLGAIEAHLFIFNQAEWSYGKDGSWTHHKGVTFSAEENYRQSLDIINEHNERPRLRKRRVEDSFDKTLAMSFAMYGVGDGQLNLVTSELSTVSRDEVVSEINELRKRHAVDNKWVPAK